MILFLFFCIYSLAKRLFNFNSFFCLAISYFCCSLDNLISNIFVLTVDKTIVAIVVNRTIVPKSVDKKLPKSLKKLAIKLIILIITSLSVIDVIILSHAILTLFNAASIPSKYVDI